MNPYRAQGREIERREELIARVPKDPRGDLALQMVLRGVGFLLTIAAVEIIRLLMR